MVNNTFFDANWNQRFLRMAREVSTWSKDPSTQVGAVLVDPLRRIVGLGYNGFPRGIEDDEQRLLEWEIKYEIVVHAEINAIHNATNTDLNSCLLYNYPLPPCSRCLSQMIQVGIKYVVSTPPPKDANIRWKDNFKLAQSLMAEVGICYCEVTLEDEDIITFVKDTGAWEKYLEFEKLRCCL